MKKFLDTKKISFSKPDFHKPGLSCENLNLRFDFRSYIILVICYLTDDFYALIDIKYKLRSVMDMELAPTPMFKSKKQIELEDDNVSISHLFKEY